MQKKAFSLIEVLIAVSLISVVITSVLKMQQNNLSFIERFKVSSKYNEYISAVVKKPSNDLKNETIRLDERVDIKDDDLRKEFKEIKIKLVEKKLKDMKLPENDYIKSAKIIESVYSIDNINKKFYTFKLQ